MLFLFSLPLNFMTEMLLKHSHCNTIFAREMTFFLGNLRDLFSLQKTNLYSFDFSNFSTFSDFFFGPKDAAADCIQLRFIRMPTICFLIFRFLIVE